MEGVVENPPHPAPPADKKTTPIGIFLYIVAFWSAKNGILSGYGRPASERGAFIPTLEKQMKKKALTLAIAAALSAPASFAATDDSGMRYTSANEGFYASLRVVYESKATKGGKGAIGNDTSRIGVRGSNDMGGGLEGFYRWEAAVNINDGHADGSDGDSKGIDTRLGLLGVRGGFGQVQFGSFWTADLNWVGAPIDRAGTTNVSNTYYSRQREGRSQDAMEYTTPNLNGFQGAVRVSTDRQAATDAITGADVASVYRDPGQAAGKGTVGLWNLATKYETHGFKVAASYNVINDGLPGNAELAAVTTNGQERGGFAASGAEDLKSWSASLSYAQDNWDVGMLYGVDNTSDSDRGVAQRGGKGGCGALGAVDFVAAANNNPAVPASASKCEDRKILAIAGGVSIDKVRITAAWEKVEQEDGLEDVDGGVEVRYTFTPVTNASVRYAIRDKETAPNDENTFRVRLEHTF